MAQWQWLSDTDWVDYDEATCEKLEKAYNSKKTKQDTDKERFVEFCSLTELRKNFHSLPKQSETLVGMQKRKDNPTRRRLVQRLVKTPFDDYIFYLVKETFDDELDCTQFINEIKSRKGNVTKKINNANIIVCDEDNWDDNVKEIIQKAYDDELPIVTCEFVKSCYSKSSIKKKDMKNGMKNEEYIEKMNKEDEEMKNKQDEEEEEKASRKRISNIDDIFESKRPIQLKMTFTKDFTVEEIDEDFVALYDGSNAIDLNFKPNVIMDIGKLYDMECDLEMNVENNKVKAENNGITVEFE